MKTNTASPVETPARALLAHATRAEHERLERSLKLASPELTLHEYAATVRCFDRVYADLEPQIDAHAAQLERDGFEWHIRAKRGLLRRDVDVLAALSPDREPPPRRALAPRFATLPEVLGCMYVLEGATLGGRVIGRNVARVLGLGPDRGASFFASYGAQVGPRWQAFCAALERAVADDVTRARAAEAARATFAFFNDHVARREEDS